MTPKEKAKQLVEKYYETLPQWVNVEDSKKCALITVDEIINYLTTSLDVQTSLNAINYLQEVKQEIEKL